MNRSAHHSPRRPHKARRLFGLKNPFLLGILLVGCSHVSPQAVRLSEQVSQRLTATQHSHEVFVQAYFEPCRERIEDFLTRRWTPHFLELYVEDATADGEDLLSLLENATPLDIEQTTRLEAAFRERGISEPTAAPEAFADALGGGETGRLTLEFSKAAIAKIERKRRELLDPIDDLERRTLSELRRSYSQIQLAGGASES